MPLTPLPADNTRRLFLITQIQGTQHSTMIRASSVVDITTLRDSVHFDFDILKSQMYSDVNLVGLEVAEKGSSVRNPVAGWATISGTGLGTTPAQHLARSFSARGRSANGRKVKMLLWGLNVGEQGDFQLDPSVGDLTTFMGLLNSSPNKYWSIDEIKPVWYSDLLEDYNDHWIRELRP